ncbi:hypothetical protein ONS95_009171 [Cadophora gregata]|uniref:uncharacterized protein n=1 Tax=Cadophora gregata TaxID=51156 RepID=UPI0026DCD5CD|nr:uncharacterized protein ONS95_009171 [Cadophora gregata]KAK0124189.1 hypothetical protein ONS95_009171 [Cadophora gregata]
MNLYRARVFKAVRMFSTLVGQSGRKYVCQKVLQHHPTKPGFDIKLALCDGKLFVLKPVSQSIFDLLQEFKDEFGNNARLRIHVDDNKTENVLVYEYFKTDLLSLCLYVITGAQCFHPDFETLDVEPEPVILFKLLSAFGPLPDALVKHVNDEEARVLLTGLWQAIAEDESNEAFEQWSEDVFPNLGNEAKRLILRMTNLDPGKRVSMLDIVKDPYLN